MDKVAECYIWSNGNVMCFGEDGEQIPEYQGFILDVAVKLAEVCDENTKWWIGKWRESLIPADFSWWFKEREED